MTSTDIGGLVVGAYTPREDPRDALCGADGDPPRACGSAPPRRGGARSCSRSSRRSRSSRCAATSTRGCASGASAVSTPSCSPRAVSTVSGSAARSGSGSIPDVMLPEAGQGALALQVRAGEERARRALSTTPETPRSRRGGARAASPSSAAAASLRSRPITTERADGARRRRRRCVVERRSGADPAALAAGARCPSRRRSLTRPAGSQRDARGVARALGYDVVLCPLIRVEPIGDGPIELTGYDWVVVTSANGARELRRRAVGVPRAGRGDRAGDGRGAGGRSSSSPPSRPRKACWRSCRARRACAVRGARRPGGCSSTSSTPTSCRSTGTIALRPTEPLRRRLARADFRLRARASSRPLGAAIPAVDDRPGDHGRRSAGRLGARRWPRRRLGRASPRSCSQRVNLQDVFVMFLTDFGLQDDFVGTCHGVIKRIAPDAEIIDVTHGIPPRAVLQGALVLANTLPYMPVGVHLSVVDPGVGGYRRALALRDREGRLFVGPDNGLLVPAAERAGIAEASSSPTLPMRSRRSPAPSTAATSSRRRRPTWRPACRSRSSDPPSARCARASGLPQPELGQPSSGRRALRRPFRQRRAQPPPRSRACGLPAGTRLELELSGRTIVRRRTSTSSSSFIAEISSPSTTTRPDVAGRGRRAD